MVYDVGALVEVEVLIPLRDNNDAAFPRRSWNELESRFREAFGGFSRTTGTVGQWKEPNSGKVYRDRSRRYTVGLTTWREFPTWLEIVEWARREFRQVVLYIRVSGVAEILA